MEYVVGDDAAGMLRCLEDEKFDESMLVDGYTLLEHAVMLESVHVVELLLVCNARGICLRQLANSPRMSSLLNNYKYT